MIINKNKICVFSDFAELARVRNFIAEHASQFGFDDKNAQEISLAVDEACTNLIRYAYHYDKKREFCVNIEHDNNQFIVNIFDDGEPFNPMEMQLPNMKNHLLSYTRGGLGLFIIRNIMDEISYHPSRGQRKKNILQLKKFVTI